MAEEIVKLLLPYVEPILLGVIKSKIEPPASAVPTIIASSTTGLTATQFEEAVALYSEWVIAQLAGRL
jgi:hypothetical protein